MKNIYVNKNMKNIYMLIKNMKKIYSNKNQEKYKC